jgi:hypothetical protein
MSLKFIQLPALTLLTGMSASATSFTVTPYPVDIQTGRKITFADLGDTPTCTIDPKILNYEEIVSVTALVDNGNNSGTFTVGSRNLIGQYPYTTAGTGKQHGATAVVVFSDNPQMYARLAAKENDETIPGLWTFNQTPIGLNPGAINDASTTAKGIARLSASPNGTPTALTSISNASPAVCTLVSHGLTADDSIIFTTTGTLPTGLSLATTYYVISAGLTANAFEVAASLGGTAINTSSAGSGTHSFTKTTPVAVGTNDTKLPTQAENDALVGNNTDIAVGTGNKMVTQTGLQHGAELYTTELSGGSTAYTATYSPAFTSVTDGMELSLKIGVTNSTTTPTFAPNGLTARTIVKLGGTALAVGDIVVGMNKFKYDLTNTRWVLQTPIANVPSTPVFSKVQTITISQACANNTVTKICDFTGLTGDTDDIYEMDYEIVGTQDSSNVNDFLYLKFNSTAATPYGYTVMRVSDAAVANANPTPTTANTAVGMALVAGSASNGVGLISGKVRIKASKTIAGTIRHITGDAFSSSTANAACGQHRSSGSWNDTGTQITSIQLFYIQNSGSSSTVTGFATLSKIAR